MRTKDPDKQKRIKEAMVNLILREGINGASVAKIATEAGVSPATIYIYYSSKEDMLAEVFREYAHHSYQYLKRCIQPEMNGAELISTIVHGYYSYTIEHEEAFSFVEQCSRCPTLSENVSDRECTCDIMDLIHEYQRRGIMRRYSDLNINAVLFAPVRYIAAHYRPAPGCGNGSAGIDEQIEELIMMLQDMLLVR